MPESEHPPRGAVCTCPVCCPEKWAANLAVRHTYSRPRGHNEEKSMPETLPPAMEVPPAEQIADLVRRLDRAKDEHVEACKLVAQMHAAAVGEVRGPLVGIVEDVANLRSQLDAVAEQLAQAREHLIWCSGASDFAPGGKAREGWDKGPGKFLNEQLSHRCSHGCPTTVTGDDLHSCDNCARCRNAQIGIR